MYTASDVNIMLVQWAEQGVAKEEIVARLAEACLGWPYVFGAVGEQCTPATRRKYCDNYKTRNPAESEQIKKTCRVLNLGVSTCNGCKFYPGGDVRCYDCRGFTRWVLGRVGITLNGGGATSQWNNAANWEFKGTIDQYNGGIAVFFQQSTTDKRVMSHTGFIIDADTIIHCSGTVKKEKLYKRITHFAIPKGLGGDIPVPVWRPTLRKGARGEAVQYVQEKLIELGYSLAPYGADGKFGAKTEETVKAFQRDHKLNPDGVVGPMTYDALENASPKPTEYYKVIIPHLTKEAADSLCKQYPGAEKQAEGGE